MNVIEEYGFRNGVTSAAGSIEDGPHVALGAHQGHGHRHRLEITAYSDQSSGREAAIGVPRCRWTLFHAQRHLDHDPLQAGGRNYAASVGKNKDPYTYSRKSSVPITAGTPNSSSYVGDWEELALTLIHRNNFSIVVEEHDSHHISSTNQPSYHCAGTCGGRTRSLLPL